MKKIVIVIVVVILVAVAALIFTRSGSSDPAHLALSGNIEVTQVQLGFRLPGWVNERRVDEGQTLEAGDVVALLDARDLQALLQQRKAAVASAQAILAALENGSRPEEIAAARAKVDQARQVLAELSAGSRPQEIRVAEAAVASAQSQLTYAETQFRRMDEMPAGAVSQTEKDLSRSNFDVAKARVSEAQERLKLAKEGPRSEQVEQARAALDAAQQQFVLIEKGPRQEDIDQARARFGEATSAMEAAELQLSYTQLATPVAGVVLSENVEPGEFVVAGTPVVTIGDLSDVWLRAYIGGEDLGRVKVGESVQIRTDSYPDKAYTGRVSFISSEAEFTPKSVQTERERTRLVYRIKVDIENPAMELKPGMPADAVISLAE